MSDLAPFVGAGVCETLGLTQADYWQRMSRARKQLCLGEHREDVTAMGRALDP